MRFYTERKRRAARRRLDRIMVSLGGRSGLVLADRISGDGWFNGPFILTVVTVRPGATDDVMKELYQAALATGYPEQPRHSVGYSFPPVGELGMLSISYCAAGEFIPELSFTVPPGHTGVIICVND